MALGDCWACWETPCSCGMAEKSPAEQEKEWRKHLNNLPKRSSEEVEADSLKREKEEIERVKLVEISNEAADRGREIAIKALEKFFAKEVK